MNARTQPEWSEKLTVGSSEAAHLFRRLRARTLKMLSVKRGRAGRLDVGARASSLTLDLHTVGLTAVHSHGYGACTAVSPAFWRGRPRAPARVPVQSPLARRCNLITPPYCSITPSVPYSRTHIHGAARAEPYCRHGPAASSMQTEGTSIGRTRWGHAARRAPDLDVGPFPW